MGQNNLYRVMVISNGYDELHTDEFETMAEAQELTDHLTELFKNNQYYVEAYEPEPCSEPRHYNERAVDGWEDIYPSY